MQCQEQCYNGVPEAVVGVFFELIECAQEFDCFDLNDSCGDGQCNNGESETTCPGDCGEPSPACGDGICEASEADSCPEDCASSTYACLVNGCELGQCLNFGGCTNAFECMASSTDAEAAEECLDGLGGPAGNVLSGVLACGINLSCWGEPSGPECGDGNCDDSEDFVTCPQDCQPPAPVCGDGICADTENISSCPADCTPVDPAQCIYSKCFESVGACTVDFGCLQGLQCLEECDGNLTCADACSDAISDSSSSALFGAVLECAEANQCIE